MQLRELQEQKLWIWSGVYKEILPVMFLTLADLYLRIEIRPHLSCNLAACPPISFGKYYLAFKSYLCQRNQLPVCCSVAVILLHTSLQDLSCSKICPASVLKLPFIGSSWMAVESSLPHGLPYSDCKIKVQIFLPLLSSSPKS